VIGVLVTSVLGGLVVFATLGATGVPFAPRRAVWVGVGEFLPLVGGLSAGVRTVKVAFWRSIVAGIVTIVVLLV